MKIMRKTWWITAAVAAVAATALGGSIAAAREPNAEMRRAERARVTIEAAARAALAVAPGTVTEAELEDEDGTLVWSLNVAGGEGIRKVLVDATTGRIVSNVSEEEEERGERGRAQARRPERPARPAGGAFRDSFEIDPARLSDRGRNDFFVLEPGHRIVLRGRNEEVVITVTDRTRDVGGVRTRVVEERETKNGRLVEVSQNFFAIDQETKDVYYFGEDVTKYRNGRPYAAEDAWLAGENGARPGLVMPGRPRLGDRYYQEVAPDVAMDRGENASLTERVETPAGVFEDCLKVVETSPLEPGERSVKFYARGIGMIYDGGLRLAERPAARATSGASRWTSAPRGRTQ